MPDITEPRFTRPGFSGQDVPFYGLKFDKKGKSKSPETQGAMPAVINDGGFTDVIIFSHGWNNDWGDAINLYTEFLDGVGGQATQHANLLPSGIKPMMIGLSWPSAALVWPWERSPRIASFGRDDASDDAEPNDIESLSEDLSEANAQALRALVSGKDTLTRDEMEALADIILPAMEGSADEITAEGRFTRDELVAMLTANELAAPPEPEDDDEEDPFAAGGTAGGDSADPEAAGIVSDLFGIRTALRLTTVRRMKDRAGVVGRVDVSRLISAILENTNCRLHLVGHSYGTKVVMSGLVASSGARPVTSALLLQPAINNLAFANSLDGGRMGGFRPALKQVEKPILTTESHDDGALRLIFHLALRRKKDIGEEPMFAGFSERFHAMGGYGPSGLADGELLEIEMPAAGSAYPPFGGAEIVNLQATGKIKEHSDVTNDFTFWAMIHGLT